MRGRDKNFDQNWIKIGFGNEIMNDEEKIESTKIGFSNQVNHVRMNSSKHFSGPKRIPHVIETVPVTMITIFDALRIYIITTLTTHHFTISNNFITAAPIVLADTMIVISDSKFERITLKIA